MIFDVTGSLYLNNFHFDAAANTPDFEVEWIEAIAFNLAYKLTFGSGMPMNERLLLKEDARQLLNDAKNDSTEKADMEISPRIGN